MRTFINNFFKKRMRDSELFDKSVHQFFEPIARKLELPLFKVDDDIYEIPSPYFILRVRLHTGHHRGLNVFLRQSSFCDFDENIPGSEYGLGWFMGEDKNQLPNDACTDDDFIKQVQLFAAASEHFGAPYLLGQQSDLENIKEMVSKKIEEGRSERERLKEMQRNITQNLPSVRQEWPVVIPAEKGEKRIAAKELRVANIQFLGEQVGQDERILKGKLVECFNRDQSVTTAYLARFIGHGTPANAALCMRTQFGPDSGLVEKCSAIFATVFEDTKQLNVIFLTGEQESSLAKLCQPFFRRDH